MDGDDANIRNFILERNVISTIKIILIVLTSVTDKNE
jgi:hypothetical protein